LEVPTLAAVALALLHFGAPLAYYCYLRSKWLRARYVRKALRSGAWQRLRRESRLLLRAVARYIRVVKSPVLREVLRGILLEIEPFTLRGRAVFYGVLVALRRGLVEALRDLKRLITLGIGYLNLPLMWRVLG